MSSGTSRPRGRAARADFRVVGHRGERPGIGVAMFAAAGAAVQRAEVRIVVGHAAVPAQHHEPAEVLGQPDGAQARLRRYPACSRHGEPERAGARRVGGSRAVHRHAGGDRVTEPARHRVGDRRLDAGSQRLAGQPRAEQEAQHVDEHQRRQRVLLQIVEQMVGQPSATASPTRRPASERSCCGRTVSSTCVLRASAGPGTAGNARRCRTPTWFIATPKNPA